MKIWETLKNSFTRIDLHIVVIEIMVLILCMLVGPAFSKSIPNAYAIGFTIGLILFIFPQGIILTKVLKREKFRLKIDDMEYFIVNEILALFFSLVCFVYINMSLMLSFLMMYFLAVIIWFYRLDSN